MFTLAGDEYALPIDKVQEIVRYSRPRRLGGYEPWIAGVISLRGKIIPVGDLGLRLGHDPHPGQEAKIVIVDCTGGTTGIIVDDVTGVLAVDAERLAIPAAGTDFMREIAQVGDRLVVVIDPERLFADLDLTGAGEDSVTPR